MRKNSIKRGLAASLAALMAFGAVGCGGSASTETTGSTTAASQESSNAGTGEGTTAAGSENEMPYAGVKLKWATTDNAATGSEHQEMVAMIKEKTGIEIEFSITPTSKSGEMDKVLVSLMAGDDIDIISRTPLQLEEFNNAGVLASLDELAQNAGYDMEAMYGSNLTKFDGQTYGMPSYRDIWLTYYNKKIFDDAGVEYPSAEGWTWEKYVETAQKLTDASKNIYGSFIGDDPATMYVLASQSGVSAYKEDGSANFDDPIFRESMEWFGSLGNELKIQPSSLDQASGTHPYNEFLVNGNIAMWVQGGWVASTLADQEKYPRDWQAGILPMPYPEGQEPSSLSINSCYAIPSTSKNKEAAFEAIRILCENQYLLGHGRVPSKNLTEEEAKSYVEEQLVPIFTHDGITAEDLMKGWFDSDRNYVSEKIMGTADTVIGQIFTEEGTLYLQGQKSLDDTMASIQKRANEAIKEASEQ